MQRRSFEDVQKFSSDLRASYSNRDTLLPELENMFLLIDNELPDEDWIKKTISPDARDAVIGAVRILAAGEPVFSAGYNTDDDQARDVASKLEKWCTAVWKANNRLKKGRVQRVMALSAFLYDEVHVVVRSAKNVAEITKDPRAQRIAKQTPILIDVISPKVCYPLFDSMGLTAHYSSRKMRVSDIVTIWGEQAPGVEGKKPTDTVDYNEFWDIVSHVVWITGSDQPILDEEHKLPMIPIACGVAEGTEELFSEADQPRRQPFLYSLYQTKLWQRMNLAYTVMYSLIGKGMLPQIVHERSQEGNQIQLDLSLPFGVLEVPTGDRVHELQKTVVDPQVMNALQFAEQKGEATTIYRQTLGQSLGSNATYSTTALLSQAGRLPLSNYQALLSGLIGDVAVIALSLMRDAGGTSSVDARGEKGAIARIELTGSEIPEFPDIEATLEPDLPQDDRANAQLLAQLAGGQQPLVSRRWGLEKILRVGQPEEMEKEIMTEQATWAMFGAQLQTMLQQIQAAAQTPQPPAGAPNMPPGGPPMQPGGMPPEMMQQPGMGAPAQSGMPMAAPGEMAQPGMPSPDQMAGLMPGMDAPGMGGV